MKGYYSRFMQEKRHSAQDQQQTALDQQRLDSKLKQRDLIQRTNQLRQQKKLEEAKRRLEELQRQQEEQSRRRDHRDRYIQYMRKGSNKSIHRQQDKKLVALDLEVGTHIPKPVKLRPVKLRVIEKGSRIPKLRGNDLWRKGGLLDSLDLSSTNLLAKKQKFEIEEEAPAPEVTQSPLRGGKPKEPKEPKVYEQDSLEEKGWLRESFNQSIKEWAGIRPIKLTAPSVISEEPEEIKVNAPNILRELVEDYENAMQVAPPSYRLGHLPQPHYPDVIKPSLQNPSDYTKVVDSPKEVPKKSKYVQKFKQIKQVDDDFLAVSSIQTELACLNSEEAKLQASLAKLDAKITLGKVTPNIPKPTNRRASVDREEKRIEESLDRLTEMLDNRSVFGSEAPSVFSAPEVSSN